MKFNLLNNTDKNFEVSVWFTSPGINDDCLTAEGFDTETEARDFLRDVAELEISFNYFDAAGCWLALSSNLEKGRILLTRRVPGASEPDETDELWSSERRMQNAMAFGVEGWNDSY